MDSFAAVLDIDPLSLIVGNIVAFGIGALWYNPMAFGRIWQKAQPKRLAEDYQMKASDMVLQFLAMLLINVMFAWMARVIAYGFEPQFSEWAAAWLAMSVVVAMAQFSNWIFSNTLLPRVLVDIGYASTAMLSFGLIALLFQNF